MPNTIQVGTNRIANNAIVGQKLADKIGRAHV